MKRISFLKLRYPMFLVSGIVILVGIIGLFSIGFNKGLEFQPGLSERIELTLSPAPSSEAVRSVLADVDPTLLVQSVGGENSFVVRVGISDVADREAIQTKIHSTLKATYGESNVGVVSSSFVGPSMARLFATQAIVLIAIALLLILLYIWFRFQFGFAVSAIAALAHDVFIIIAIMVFLRVELSVATIASLLTIVGYSLNDTIVVFDRIRENKKIIQGRNLRSIIDISITQSLSRTIITSLTTLLAVIALFIFTDGSVQAFAFNMMVGIVVGTYSSIFIASPLYYEIYRLRHKNDERHAELLRDEHPEEAKAADEAVVAATSVDSDDPMNVEIVRVQRKLHGKRRQKR